MAAFALAPSASAMTITVSGTAPDKVLTINSDGSTWASASTPGAVFEIKPMAGTVETVTAPNCTASQIDPATVYCGNATDYSKLVFNGGSGDDRLTVDVSLPIPPGESTSYRLAVEAHGDAGADRLAATFALAGASLLDGGDGDDELSGGPGDDELQGGTGNDTLVGDDGSDLLDGGPGADDMNGNNGYIFYPPGPMYVAPPATDVVDYSSRTAPVIVDNEFFTTIGAAKPGTGGEAGEGDTLWAIEEIRGGAGDDVIRGGYGDERLGGAGGNDVVSGRDGNDEIVGGIGDDDLTGGGGTDSVNGGEGDDFLDTYDRLGDDVDCGAGAGDMLFADNTLDLAGASGCETVAPEAEGAPSIAGSAVIGQTLSATVPTFSGSSYSLTRAWLRCLDPCDTVEVIPGATGDSYVVAPSDAGYMLLFVVQAENAAGSDAVASDLTDVVPHPAAPSATSVPAAPHAAPVAAPPPPAAELAAIAKSGRVRLVGTRLDVGRRATCKLGAGPCTVSLVATFGGVRGSRAQRAALAGRGSVVIAPGKSAQLAVRLTKAAVRLLHREGVLRLTVTATTTRGQAMPRTTKIRLTLRDSKRARH